MKLRYNLLIINHLHSVRFVSIPMREKLLTLRLHLLQTYKDWEARNPQGIPQLKEICRRVDDILQSMIPPVPAKRPEQEARLVTVLMDLAELMLSKEVPGNGAPHAPNRNGLTRKEKEAARKNVVISDADWQYMAATGRLTPELFELYRDDYSEEQLIADLEEMRKTGGLELKDFIHELEAIGHDDV
jgi:hypothetical protein